MPRFGLVGPTYQSQSPNLDAQLCMNFYPELDESGAGNSPIVLYSTPGTKVFAETGGTVTPEVDGLGPFDVAEVASGTGTVIALPTLTPTFNPEFVLMLEANPIASFIPGAGYAVFGTAGILFGKVITAPETGGGTLNSSRNWAAGIAGFEQFGVSAPVVASYSAVFNEYGLGGGWNTAQNSVLPHNVTSGNTMVVAIRAGENFGTPSGIVVTDNMGNPYTHVINSVGTGCECHLWVATNVIGGALQVHLSAPAGLLGTAGWSASEVVQGNAAVTQNGPIRAELAVVGRGFCVSGDQFIEVFQNGTKTIWGTVSNDSKPASMAASPQQLLIASGGVAYIFDLTSNTFSTIPGATFSGQVNQAGICDDFFLLTIRDSKEFYVSAPLDATDWVTNGSAIVSVFPDNIVSMIVDHREIWFFSDTQSVVYYDSGNIFPFDVISGAFIEAGAAATFATSQLANTVMWLGQDVRGRGKVYMANGYTPQRVSTHAIEFEIQGYSRIDDAESWTYQEDGHDFYVLYFPTPSTTLVYDVTTNMWHKRGFWVAAAAIFKAVHARCHMFIFGKHLVGDWQSATIYQQQIPTLTGTTWTFADDAGAAIVRIRRAAHISQEQKRQYLNELNVYVETGLGPQPPLLDGNNNPRGPEMVMSISRDGGHTFGYGRTRDCGQSGEYKKRVRWLRLGQARDFVIEIKVADPIGWRIVDAYIGPPEAGDN